MSGYIKIYTFGNCSLENIVSRVRAENDKMCI